MFPNYRFSDLVRTLCVFGPGQRSQTLCACDFSWPCARMALCEPCAYLVRTLCVPCALPCAPPVPAQGLHNLCAPLPRVSLTDLVCGGGGHKVVHKVHLIDKLSYIMCIYMGRDAHMSDGKDWYQIE